MLQSQRLAYIKKKIDEFDEFFFFHFILFVRLKALPSPSLELLDSALTFVLSGYEGFYVEKLSKISWRSSFKRGRVDWNISWLYNQARVVWVRFIKYSTKGALLNSLSLQKADLGLWVVLSLFQSQKVKLRASGLNTL